MSRAISKHGVWIFQDLYGNPMRQGLSSKALHQMELNSLERDSGMLNPQRQTSRRS